MPIEAKTLFPCARRIELDIAAIYEDLAANLTPGSGEAKFFARLAAQEHMHAAWVDEMEAAVAGGFVFDDLEAGDFETLLETIADVRDEVSGAVLSVPELLEIVLHMENSIAENFYLFLPIRVPGLPDGMVRRMVRSCVDHAALIRGFRDACIEKGQAGVHTPEGGDPKTARP